MLWPTDGCSRFDMFSNLSLRSGFATTGISDLVFRFTIHSCHMIEQWSTLSFVLLTWDKAVHFSASLFCERIVPLFTNLYSYFKWTCNGFIYLVNMILLRRNSSRKWGTLRTLPHENHFRAIEDTKVTLCLKYIIILLTSSVAAITT